MDALFLILNGILIATIVFVCIISIILAFSVFKIVAKAWREVVGRYHYSSSRKTYRMCNLCGSKQFKPKKYHGHPEKNIWIEVARGVNPDCECRKDAKILLDDNHTKQ